MGAEEADTGGVEQQADGNAPFIASGSAHPGFDCIHGDIPESQQRKEKTIFFQEPS